MPRNDAHSAAIEETVRVRKQEPADDERVLEIQRILNPEFPRLRLEEYRQMIASLPQGVSHERFVSESEGSVVGDANVLQKFWVGASGSYVMQVAVHPDWWRHGIGGRLCTAAEEKARELGAERVFADVREDRPEGTQFAQARGFTSTGHIARLSRLEVRNAQLPGYAELEDRLTREGVRVSTLADLEPDDALKRELYDVSMETARDEPASETFEVSYERWLEFIEKMPGLSYRSVFVALDGDRVIGLTMLKREGENSAWNMGMGVLRSYRGRGVARLLKLQSTRWAEAAGIEYLYTGNDVNNPRMYDINIRLGYKPLPANVEYVKEL